jgi:hypothetical protein
VRAVGGRHTDAGAVDLVWQELVQKPEVGDGLLGGDLHQPSHKAIFLGRPTPTALVPRDGLLQDTVDLDLRALDPAADATADATQHFVRTSSEKIYAALKLGPVPATD